MEDLDDLDDLAECFSSVYRGDHFDLGDLIFRTLTRLPKEVQHFVCEHCRILSIGQIANAITLSGSIVLPFPLHFPEGIRWAIDQGKIEELLSNPPKLVLLSEQIVEEYEAEDVMSIVAHEIAHAYLGHDPINLGRNEANIAAEREVDACELARQWGFSGRGTDAESRAAVFTDYFTSESRAG